MRPFSQSWSRELPNGWRSKTVFPCGSGLAQRQEGRWDWAMDGASSRQERKAMSSRGGRAGFRTVPMPKWRGLGTG